MGDEANDPGRPEVDTGRAWAPGHPVNGAARAWHVGNQGYLCSGLMQGTERAQANHSPSLQVSMATGGVSTDKLPQTST